MSFRPPYQGYGNYYYSYVQNGAHRTIIINENSNFPFDNTRRINYYTDGYTNSYTSGYTNNNFTNGLAAQQPFPDSVRIKFSAPPLKQRIVKKNHKFSKKSFVILLSLIVIFLFVKRSFMSNAFFSNGWHEPDIPWKGPKNFEIDTKEFKNLEIIVSGHAAQGNLFVTRSSNDNVTSIIVKVEILLSDETLQNKVEIFPFYDSSNYILQVKTPDFCASPNCVSTNINITFPRNLKEFGNFFINVINLNINNDDLKDITFDNINWKLNPSINVKNLKSHEISVKSSGQISGNYYIDDSLLLQTSNSQINATTKSFSDSTPKSIKLFTSNSAIRGSFPSAKLFQAHTSNGGIDLKITQNKQQNTGKIVLDTNNGIISGVYDVSSEWHASTSNGNINAKLNLVNLFELVRISGMTSNGIINTSISDSYKGRFHLQTTNGKTTIRGSYDNINYNVNTHSLKTGYKREYNNNELSLYSSNGKINLDFF